MKRRLKQITGIMAVGASLAVVGFFASVLLPHQPIWTGILSSAFITLCYVTAWQDRGQIQSWHYFMFVALSLIFMFDGLLDRPFFALAGGLSALSLLVGGAAMKLIRSGD